MSKLKYFKMAMELNKEKHDELKKKQCHFRGGFGSMSLISVAFWSPERGKSGIKNEGRAEEKLKSFKVDMPGRSTPEKQLQAWLINRILFHDAPEFWESRGLNFLTSELKKDNLVNDILAVDDKGSIWVIELKSARYLDELIRQTNGFAEVVKSNEDEFAELVAVLSGSKLKWTGAIKKMIIWPSSPSGQIAKTTRDKLAKHDIESVEYTGPEFGFIST